MQISSTDCRILLVCLMEGLSQLLTEQIGEEKEKKISSGLVAQSSPALPW